MGMAMQNPMPYPMPQPFFYNSWTHPGPLSSVRSPQYAPQPYAPELQDDIYTEHGWGILSVGRVCPEPYAQHPEISLKYRTVAFLPYAPTQNEFSDSLNKTDIRGLRKLGHIVNQCLENRLFFVSERLLVCCSFSNTPTSS